MSTEVFRLIRNLNPEDVNFSVTVMEGDHAGEKAILSNKQMVYASSETGFFMKNKGLAGEITQSGILDVEGCRVYAERLGRRKKLVVCGAGHVALPVIRIAKMVGFTTICIEDRSSFAQDAREACADRVIEQDYSQALGEMESDEDTYFVVVTREHQFDMICLRRILKMKRAYVGLLGSKRRAALMKVKLSEEGFDREDLDGIHTPVGLDIDAETPEEIAVSILAEIIQIKNRGYEDAGFSDEILSGIIDNCGETENEGVVLATIVAKNGAAPRRAGSKMVILPDGRIIGTIGGGILELNAIRKALELFGADDQRTRIIREDLTAGEESAEGMVCGGVIHIFMEHIR